MFQIEDKLNILDFKKAILNTLVQALKAISGSVVALIGQLIKAGGYIISSKGHIISSVGKGIFSFGGQLTRSALISAPKFSNSLHKFFNKGNIY